MRRVLITGGCGMVGSYLTQQLRDSGVSVIVLDNMSRGKNRFDGIDYIIGDACDIKTCQRAVEGCDAVFNLAAEVAGVSFNQKHHTMMFNNNMCLQKTILQAAVDYGVRKFLQVSSVCIYASLHISPALEDYGWSMEPTQANIGYSMAKRMGERLALWYKAEYDIDVFIVRPSNIYGKWDYFDDRAHVIPALIKKCLNDDVITVKGDGRTFREFIYAGDAADAMRFVMENGKSGEVYNVGTNGQTMVNTRELLSMIEAIIGEKKQREHINDGSTGDSMRWSDCSKINSLGWKYQTSLIDGLKIVVDWYKNQDVR